MKAGMYEIIGYIFRTISYLVRSITLRQKAERSVGWLVQMGTISRSTVKNRLAGCVGEVSYTYTYNGEYYGGTHRKPFVLMSAAKDYVDRFEPGSDVSIRVNPGNPEFSFVHQDDQTSRRRFVG